MGFFSEEHIIVQDFSKFYTKSGKVSDLVVVLYSKDENLQWKYLDYFSKDNQDFYFVQMVWMHLLGESKEINEQCQKLIIWSDGAKQHFKQAKTLYWFSHLAATSGKQIIWNFFASNHGHSICDSHTGNGKQQIARYEREMQEQILDLEDIQEVYENHLSYTTTFNISSPREMKKTLTVKPFHGISYFHQFHFIDEGYVKCRVLSNEWPIEQHAIRLLEPSSIDGPGLLAYLI